MLNLQDYFRAHQAAQTNAVASRAAALGAAPTPFHDEFICEAFRRVDLAVAAHETAHALVAIILGLPCHHAALVDARRQTIGGYVSASADFAGHDEGVFDALLSDFREPRLDPKYWPHFQIAAWAAYVVDDQLGLNRDNAYRDRWVVHALAEQAVGGPSWIPGKGPRPAVHQLIAQGEKLAEHLVRHNWAWFERCVRELVRARRLTAEQIRALQHKGVTR
jgi:hypothetical protein